MTEDSPSLALSPGAQRLLAAAVEQQEQCGHATLGVNHWLAAVAAQLGPMAQDLAAEFEPGRCGNEAQAALKQQQTGTELTVEQATALARDRATRRGAKRVMERDVVSVVLEAAGYQVPGEAPPETAVPTAAVAPGAEDYRPRCKRPTPLLDEFGQDLTRAARQGALAPVMWRDDELQLTIETICRRTKRNPALIGPAGVGKTAIAEGLAQRIVTGQVPALLRNVRLIALQPSVLTAGASHLGELEERMGGVLREAAQDGIILFIDEIHTVMGAGGMPGRTDLGSMLKPALARGEIACLAATTDDEYRRLIEPDAALERRFQPIRVQELSAAQSLEILRSLREQFRVLRGVELPEEVLQWLVDFAQEYLKNRHFPDKAVDLLEQCVAHALTKGLTALTVSEAQETAQRLVGMPLSVDERLAALREQLPRRCTLCPGDLDRMVDRLAVSARGMDLRVCRPNCVVLLVNEAAEAAADLTATVAEYMMGSADRLVSIDLGKMTQPEHITLLAGAPPMYVGYGEATPLHVLQQMPWSVVVFDGIDACHPQIAQAVTRMLSDGCFTDGQGRRLYLSDTVVLLTARAPLKGPRSMGFDSRPKGAPDYRQVAEKALGEELVAECDLICGETAQGEQSLRRFISEDLLPAVGEQWRRHGVTVKWDESFVNWLVELREQHEELRDWERHIESSVLALLLKTAGNAQPGKVPALLVKYCDGGLQVQAEEAPG